MRVPRRSTREGEVSQRPARMLMPVGQRGPRSCKDQVLHGRMPPSATLKGSMKGGKHDHHRSRLCLLCMAGTCATASLPALLCPSGAVAACQGDGSHLSAFLLAGPSCRQGSNPKSRWTGCSRGSHAPSILANWATFPPTACQTHLLPADKRGAALCSCAMANAPQALQECLLSLCPAPN